jgi:hypothetical protein
MNLDDLLSQSDESDARRRSILSASNRAYARDGDALANFKNTASLLTQAGMPTSPAQVWGVFFFKHLTAILKAASDSGFQDREPIGGRIDDAQIYLELLRAIHSEGDGDAALRE